MHTRWMIELHSAVAGLSDVYILADHTRWFEWTTKMRDKYIFGGQKLSVKDVSKKKKMYHG